MGDTGDGKGIETNGNLARNGVQGGEEQAVESGGEKRGQVRSDLEGWGLRWALIKPTLSLGQKRGTACYGLKSATPEA